MDSLPFNAVLKDGTGGWHRNIDERYANQYSDYISVTTNAKSYDLFSRPDIFLSYRGAYSNLTVYKTFPPVNQTTWSLSGQLNYDGNYPSMDLNSSDGSGSGGTFLDVLDNNNKVLVRLLVRYNDNKRESVAYYANNQLLFADDAFNSKITTRLWQDFRVTCNAGVMAVNYAGHSISGLSSFDASANKSRPNMIRAYLWSNTNNSPRRLGMKDFVFKK